jgi:Sulfotransferase domain
LPALPNLLIIGAAKAGTTSLHEYLALHPQVFMSDTKELHFFNKEDWRDRIEWYRAQFPTDAPVRGESTPGYSMDPWYPGVPGRARELIPDARIVYLVRDPVERLTAQYVENYALHLEHRSFGEALRDYDSPSNRVVMASRYAFQVGRWREHFPDDRILVLDHLALLRERAATLRETFAFLGVDPDFTTSDFDRLHNVRSNKMRANRFGLWLYERGLLERVRRATRALPDRVREPLKTLVADPVPTPDLDHALRAELEAHLHEDAQRLRAYTGKPFAHWSV